MEKIINPVTAGSYNETDHAQRTLKFGAKAITASVRSG